MYGNKVIYSFVSLYSSLWRHYIKQSMSTMGPIRQREFNLYLFSFQHIPSLKTETVQQSTSFLPPLQQPNKEHTNYDFHHVS